MNAVITGATGFLGREVVRELLAAGHAVTALGRDPARLSGVLGALPCRCVATDYGAAQLRSACERCDAVVHLAAKRYQRGDRSLTQYEDNVRVTESMLEAAEAAGVPAFVFASTCGVYSPHVNPVPFLESAAVSPGNPYAISKCIGELLGRTYRLRFVALRFAQLIGLGEREGFLVSTFVANALARRPLTVFGEGQGRREYLYVRDAARAGAMACVDSRASGVVNIGSGEATSALELAQAMSDVLGDGLAPVVLDRSRAEDPACSCMDVALARQVLGWSPAYSLRGALLDMRKEHDAPSR